MVAHLVAVSRQQSRTPAANGSCDPYRRRVDTAERTRAPPGARPLLRRKGGWGCETRQAAGLFLLA